MRNERSTPRSLGGETSLLRGTGWDGVVGKGVFLAKGKGWRRGVQDD